MQDLFSLIPPTLTAVTGSFSEARIKRFYAKGVKNHHQAISVWVWNARLCQEFYLPLQITEVAIRNAIAATLVRRYGADWHISTAFTNQLPDRYKDEISGIVSVEVASRRKRSTVDHVVSRMTFGFWAHLLTSRYENILWNGGVKRSFQNIPKNTSREDVYQRIDELRTFRNRVAHHYAIYDKAPIYHFDNIKTILSWTCKDSLWLLTQLSNPTKIINSRPKI